MRIGVFDSGLGGLTVVSAMTKIFNGAEIFYVADTKFAPYGDKSHQEILQYSLDITNYLIAKHQIDALIVACNTATSASIKYLREYFPSLIVIGTEPGIKPAIESTLSGKVGVLATPATLKGDKYQLLVNELSLLKRVELFEQACPGLVEQIEKGEITDEKTHLMLDKWLQPMVENCVDTIVLGCTHYPLVSPTIKRIMGEDIQLIETGTAIARRLVLLGQEKGHSNEGELKVYVYSTGEINTKMIDNILEDWEHCGKIMVREL